MKVKYTFVSSATVDSITSYYWDFDNGQTSTLMVPDTVVYENEGIYSPTLVLTFSSPSSLFWITEPNLITAHETVQANFEYTTPTESFLYYLLEETSNLDTGITYTFDWDIEEFPPRTGPIQEITFPRVDVFTVSLTVTDEFGCSSSVTNDITVLEEITVPNVFTPGSGQNDFFIIESITGVPLRIRIFSRTGILVHETEGTVITWDGTTASGDELNTGVYFYILEALAGDPNKLYSKAGFFHMYRKK